MNILLINPPGFQNTKAMRDLMGGFGMIITSDLIMPPLNLAYTAAVLEEAGHEVAIYDAVALRKSSEEFLKEITKYSPELIGVNTSTATIRIDLENASAIKSSLQVPAFLLGPQISVLPDYVFENSDIDLLVRGEPEYTILDLVRSIVDNSSYEGIPGLSFRQDGRIIHNPGREFIEDLDELPFPARHLLPLSEYSTPGLGKPFTTILASRGCVINCSFCPYIVAQGTKWRTRSAENVFQEIEEVYHKYGISNIQFRDAIFTFNKDRVMTICDRILEQQLKIKWTCETAARFLDEELLKRMKEAGCYSVSIGVEAGNDYIQKKYSKNKIKSKQFLAEIAAICRKVGLKTRMFFMIGFPEETIEMIRETVDLAIQVNPTTAQFTAVTPYPGTSLYASVKKDNDFNFEDFTGYKPIEINEHLSSEEVRKEVRRAYRKFYLRPTRIIEELARPRTLIQKCWRYMADFTT